MKDNSYLTCDICGSEDDIIFRHDAHLYMCMVCSDDTPRKVSRNEFNAALCKIDPEWANAPKSTRGEFYEDYCVSKGNLYEYLRGMRQSEEVA
jgi:hypothetical protein